MASGPPELPPVDPSDSSLLRRVQGGNQDAATQLYFRYAERLRQLVRSETSAALARREDPDDILQSIFTSFFRGVGQGYYDVPAGDELWKLFLVIALNKICAKGTYHRAAKRDVRVTVGGEFLERYSRHAADPEQPDVLFLKLVIGEALDQLQPLQRQMVVLRIEGFEVAEIATRTHRSKRTVERVLQDFRRQLTEILEPPG
jgi:RNA polymerase sigma-70 factor, ECF subfamily